MLRVAFFSRLVDGSCNLCLKPIVSYVCKSQMISFFMAEENVSCTRRGMYVMNGALEFYFLHTSDEVQ